MLKRLVLMFVIGLIISIPTFSQVVPTPTDWSDVIKNLNIYLGSLAGIAALTIFLAAIINTWLKTMGFVKQLVAWGVSIAIMFLGNLLNLGFAAELTWLNTLIYGLAAGFIANGIFDIEIVKIFLQWLKIEAVNK